MWRLLSSIPPDGFVLFFIIFAFVATLAIVKIRADVRAAQPIGRAPLPSARIAGARLSWRERILRPSAIYYGLAASALCSFVTCLALTYRGQHRSPEPEERRAYEVYDLDTGKSEARDLTDTEIRDGGYKTFGEGLADKVRQERENGKISPATPSR